LKDAIIFFVSDYITFLFRQRSLKWNHSDSSQNNKTYFGRKIIKMGLFKFGKKKEKEEAKVVETKVEEVKAEATPVVEEAAPKAASTREGHLTVRIFCSAGASTSLWAQNVQKAMDAASFDGDIQAYSISVVDDEAKDADIVLIGPQTRYMENEVKAKFPDKTVAVVPMQTFGLMNGEKGLEFIETL
jgi:PTS system cellobiose-specific IIB component